MRRGVSSQSVAVLNPWGQMTPGIPHGFRATTDSPLTKPYDCEVCTTRRAFNVKTETLQKDAYSREKHKETRESEMHTFDNVPWHFRAFFVPFCGNSRVGIFTLSKKQRIVRET
jgi:hypothetical protein